MTTIILATLLAFIFAFLATQNTNPVTIKAADFVFNGVPLYLVVLGALFVGLLISWIFNLADLATSSIKIHSRESKIKETSNEIDDLMAKIHHLEVENASLKGRDQIIIDTNPKVEHHQSRKNLFERLKTSLT